VSTQAFSSRSNNRARFIVEYAENAEAKPFTKGLQGTGRTNRRFMAEDELVGTIETGLGRIGTSQSESVS
jgi:hypothetical protein